MKEILASIENNMLSINSLYPEALYLLAGDFNTSATKKEKELKLLNDFCNKWNLTLHRQAIKPTFQRKVGDQYVRSELDYAITSKCINAKEIPTEFTPLSDNRPLVWNYKSHDITTSNSLAKYLTRKQHE